MSVKFRGVVILVAVLLVKCLSLEIPKDAKPPATETTRCREGQCTADVPDRKPTSGPPTPDVNDGPSTKRTYADVIEDEDAKYTSPLPALKRHPTKEEMEEAHKRLEEQLYRAEHPDEPAKHVLERWGFFDTPTFGELDLKRDKEYSAGISAFEEMIKDDKKLTKREKDNINAELEKFLEDDHNFQVWTAHVYKQEKNKRKKRGIPEEEIHSYFDMPNPYYQKKK